ncbi:MAG: hypothetical protein R3Y07_06385 [Eubacteriales bacterium]
MNTTIEYRCPNCNATLRFDSQVQQLTCDYCETELTTEAIREYSDTLHTTEDKDCEWESYGPNDGSGTWSTSESNDLVVHICKSCGGEIVAEKTTAVTACPYCDNNVFVPSQFSDDLKPDYVIPFKLNKEQAKSALRGFYKGKVLLNPLFKTENHLDEVRGVYVPFWLFDCDTDSDIHYKATKVRHYSDSKFNYTETKHYSVKRGGSANFYKIPADGSSKMDDTTMESMEPYHYKDLVEFDLSYFAGYLADKYDVDSKELQNRVNTRIHNSLVEAFRPRGYNTTVVQGANIRATDRKVSYALLPVWILNTKYKGMLHTFMINGQTGKVVGKLPIDKLRCAGLFCSIAGLISLITCGGAIFLL